MIDADTRTYNEFADRLAGMTTVPDGIGLLTEFIEACARNDAEKVFFRAQTEPDWAEVEVQAFADRTIHIRVIAITDTMHAYGGTVEMVQDLAKAAAIAFGTRLGELSQAYGKGGSA